MKKEYITLRPMKQPNGETVYRSPSETRPLDDEALITSYRREQQRQHTYTTLEPRNPSDIEVVAKVIAKSTAKAVRFTAKVAWATVQTVGNVTIAILLDQVAKGAKRRYPDDHIDNKIKISNKVVITTTVTTTIRNDE